MIEQPFQTYEIAEVGTDCPVLFYESGELTEFFLFAMAGLKTAVFLTFFKPVIGSLDIFFKTTHLQ